MHTTRTTKHFDKAAGKETFIYNQLVKNADVVLLKWEITCNLTPKYQQLMTIYSHCHINQTQVYSSLKSSEAWKGH